MSIRVLTERVVKAGCERQVGKLLRQLQAKAIETPGFISSEPLRDLEQPQRLLVLSSWHNMESWQTWLENDERRKINNELSPMLIEQPKNRILQPPRHDVFLL
eukprot:GILI01026105.1.p2 GENE.GILI01026105.1~~GILI01026105.1.p2  ORF type:complete len:103 (-),score=12.86 GILI01026105.1:31-339(-)